jgi:hypothetical protein
VFCIFVILDLTLYRLLDQEVISQQVARESKQSFSSALLLRQLRLQHRIMSCYRRLLSVSIRHDHHHHRHQLNVEILSDPLSLVVKQMDIRTLLVYRCCSDFFAHAT